MGWEVAGAPPLPHPFPQAGISSCQLTLGLGVLRDFSRAPSGGGAPVSKQSGLEAMLVSPSQEVEKSPAGGSGVGVFSAQRMLGTSFHPLSCPPSWVLLGALSGLGP